MKARKLVGVFAIAVLFFLVVGSSSTSLAQGIYEVDLKKALAKTPYSKWVERFEAARAENRDFRVESVEEFIKLHEYYNAFLNDGTVIHSFKTKLGEQIHCIEIKSQQAVRAAGLDPDNIPIVPTQIPENEQGDKSDQEIPAAIIDMGLDGSPDEAGRARKCPAGSFPKLIRPIETYYRFEKLEDIFKKYPPGHSRRPLFPNESYTKENHEYGCAYNFYENKGLQADFNIWSPDVASPYEFSLGQLWVSAGGGYDLQTAETGWQVYPYMYGNDHANLFIFYTPDNYETGCYNLDCGGFVQTDGSVVIGGGFPNYSTIGGQQHHVTLGFIRDGQGGNHWWLKFNNTWVGYYPNSLFDSDGIAEQAGDVVLGGEIIDELPGGNHTDTEMGSGRFPEEGYQYAAYIKKIKYVDLSDDLVSPSRLYTDATIPTCWGVGDVENSSDVDWKAHFYFGGSCDNYVGDDDDNDDNDDDNDDNDDNDDDDDDDDDVGNDSADCSRYVGIVYNDCDFVFVDNGEPMPPKESFQRCLDDVGAWRCIFSCAEDERVNSCTTFRKCMEGRCGVDVRQDKQSDDDDDDEGCCGC